MTLQKATSTICVLLQSVLIAQTSPAPCENKTGFAKQACEVESGHVSVGPGALSGFKAEPLTTNFSDTIHPDTLPPSIDPKAFQPMSKLPRRDDGAFLLKVGYSRPMCKAIRSIPANATGSAARRSIRLPLRDAAHESSAMC
jgi:hypothetical protein